MYSGVDAPASFGLIFQAVCELRGAGVSPAFAESRRAGRRPRHELRGVSGNRKIYPSVRLRCVSTARTMITPVIINRVESSEVFSVRIVSLIDKILSR
jgi:hypothetical protein